MGTSLDLKNNFFKPNNLLKGKSIADNVDKSEAHLFAKDKAEYIKMVGMGSVDGFNAKSNNASFSNSIFD